MLRLDVAMPAVCVLASMLGQGALGEVPPLGVTASLSNSSSRGEIMAVWFCSIASCLAIPLRSGSHPV